jgi:predicted RecA/RadA family phage recombinase
MFTLFGLMTMGLLCALALSMYGTTYKQAGDILPYTNPSASTAIAVDTVVSIGGKIGVAMSKLAASGAESVNFYGVHDLPALSTDTWKMGDMLWWDPTNLVLTRLGTPVLWPAGIAAADKAVTTGVRATVKLNDFTSVPPSLLGKTVIDTAVDLTFVAATHSGAIINVTADAKTVTLPTGVAGMEALIVNNVADGGALVTVDLDGNEIIAGANLTIAATKTANNTKATAKRGDYLHLICNVAATSWRCVDRRGTWVTS